MPVQRAVDRNISTQEKLYRLLGRMLKEDASDTTKKQWCDEFTSYVQGQDIRNWLFNLGLQGETGVDRGMGYVDIFVPIAHVPQWYQVRHQKEHPNTPMEQPKVRFYMTMRETKGSKDPGVGPLNPKEQTTQSQENPTKG